jgi:hypothetical protein
MAGMGKIKSFVGETGLKAASSKTEKKMEG